MPERCAESRSGGSADRRYPPGFSRHLISGLRASVPVPEHGASTRIRSNRRENGSGLRRIQRDHRNSQRQSAVAPGSDADRRRSRGPAFPAPARFCCPAPRRDRETSGPAARSSSGTTACDADVLKPESARIAGRQPKQPANVGRLRPLRRVSAFPTRMIAFRRTQTGVRNCARRLRAILRDPSFQQPGRSRKRLRYFDRLPDRPPQHRIHECRRRRLPRSPRQFHRIVHGGMRRHAIQKPHLIKRHLERDPDLRIQFLHDRALAYCRSPHPVPRAAAACRKRCPTPGPHRGCPDARTSPPALPPTTRRARPRAMRQKQPVGPEQVSRLPSLE